MKVQSNLLKILLLHVKNFKHLLVISIMSRINSSGNHVLNPRCYKIKRMRIVCEECKKYKGCEKVNEPLQFPSIKEEYANSISDESLFESAIHEELCYLPHSHAINSTCLNFKQEGYLNCSEIDTKYCSTFKKCPFTESFDNVYGDKGGLFVTLNSSSLFNGWLTIIRPI